MHRHKLVSLLIAAAFPAAAAAAAPVPFIGPASHAVKQEQVQSAAVYEQAGATAGTAANRLAAQRDTPRKLAAMTALADDRDDYNRRSAERYVAMFRSADLNRDDVVSRVEATGIIELEVRFDDIDVNRDGSVTWIELTRYIDNSFPHGVVR